MALDGVEPHGRKLTLAFRKPDCRDLDPDKRGNCVTPATFLDDFCDVFHAPTLGADFLAVK